MRTCIRSGTRKPENMHQVLESLSQHAPGRVHERLRTCTRSGIREPEHTSISSGTRNTENMHQVLESPSKYASCLADESHLHQIQERLEKICRATHMHHVCYKKSLVTYVRVCSRSATRKTESTTGRQPPPLSSVLFGIIYKRCSVVAAQVLLREKSGA